MAGLPAEFYVRGRASVREFLPINESEDPPPERWMQQIWRHQRLRRDLLRSVQGRTLKVLHPGYWNREPGPDFRQAVLQWEDDPPVTGDIELDRELTGWTSHHHAGNPAYAQVILHIIWAPTVPGAERPILALQPYLDAPLAELVPWLEFEAVSRLPPGLLGRCCAPLQDVPDSVVAEFLIQAATDRLHRKAREFAIRARHVGWDQALWEGLFTALGYKHNGWPLRRLAEVVSEVTDPDPLGWEARLLGLSGLLPVNPPRHPGAIAQVQQLWDHWWREQERWTDQILPGTVWRLGGIRPANHPQRRLALAARWRAAGTLPARLLAWLTDEPDSRCGPASTLLDVLQPDGPADDFWAHHWTLRSARRPEDLPLLGPARSTDLAVNVILPWLRARADCGNDRGLLARVDERFFHWPAGQDNALLRQARTRLLAGSHQRIPRTAAAQQGLLQILRDFCEPAGPLCSACRFPDLVRQAAEAVNGKR
ncbi:MAG: DUF2851 family protein [Verrucomicrobia bacterium]|nr:DUF2851 family protein [Verrucomicrobiota bacterium]